ncbi:MAG: DUF4422 domain-containing protein [Synergistaceae bacterium]|nr:DUF4422 domain-containing protein [Synergistaceae bacterium]MBQ9629274.1 DUF4422 domain-containing protein [Synergistaceae bacterium]
MSRAKSQSNALKILICYYDSYGLPPLDDGILFPIQAGRTISDTDLHIQGDNELNGQACDNISEKNPTYSELTALYWAWKNLKKIYPDVKYVGWTHYRRFFAFHERKYFTSLIEKPAEEIRKYRVNPDEIINILESGRIITAKRDSFLIPVYWQYSQCHSSEDYRTLRKVINEKFPDYYETFMNFMERNNKISLFCMFIMKYDEFIKYCEWLFSVLSEVEPLLIHSEHYNSGRKRVFAYMAERLMNVYILKNKLKTKELNVYFYEKEYAHKSIFKKFFSYVHRVLGYVKREITLRLITGWKSSPKS